MVKHVTFQTIILYIFFDIFTLNLAHIAEKYGKYSLRFSAG
jgi:hypothetical protein